MPCRVTGTSHSDYEFECLSGKSASDKQCTIGNGITDIKHVVIVAPVRKKFNKIQVTGRINAEVTTTHAKFDGGSVLTEVEWRETKNISLHDVTFSSAAIHRVSAGSENIKTLVEEIDWAGNYSRVDQNDLEFTITLS